MSRLTLLYVLALVLNHSSFATQPDQTWRDRSPHTNGFVAVNGVDLHFLDWGGTGEVLLFIPGLGQSAHIFDGLAPHFADNYHVLGLTLRGQGKSGRPETGYDTGTLVEDIKAFLDAQKIQTVILVGHSMAGNELTEFARQYPQRIRKLIYIEAAYDFREMPPSEQDPVKIERPSQADLASVDAGMRWFERVFDFTSAAVEADVREVNLKPDGTMTMESTPPAIAAQLWKGMISYAPRYDSISAPILAIYAISEFHPFLRPNSTAVEREQGNAFWHTEWIPYQKHSIDQLLDSRGPVQVVILRNTKHLCFIAKQDEAQVVQAMRAFLAPRSSPSAGVQGAPSW